MVPNTYGKWIVTTEGDVEGRSIRQLGTHEGHVDEIAFVLASQSYYALHFKRCVEIDISPDSYTKESVFISIDNIGANLTNEGMIEKFKMLFKDRDVSVSRGTYYQSIKLELNNIETIMDMKKSIAMAKLTSDDIKILGL